MRTVPLAGILLLLGANAFANDGAAGLDGGGLHFKALKGVSMVEEVLSISPTEVRVRYVFENTTDRDISTRVSFPIQADLQGDLSWDRTSKNPSDFSVTVDGKSVAFETKVEETEESLTLQHHWMQAFPARAKRTIEHRYTPIFPTGVAYMAPASEGPTWGDGLKRSFCATAKEAAWVAKKGYEYKPLTYVLKTARTWDGPIRAFTLRLSKGRHPGLFLCTDLKLVKQPDGSFEAKATDYVPSADLTIAFVDDFPS